MPSSLQPIFVTSGEPAGIGPDICLDLVHLNTSRPVVVLGDQQVLAQRAMHLGRDLAFIPYQGQHAPAQSDQLYIVSIPVHQAVQAGKLDSANAPSVVAQLQYAAQAALTGQCAAIVTAPVQKSIINAAGIDFSGHTEFFQHYAQIERVVMMLATTQLRVALVTTHLPLRDVAQTITTERLHQVIDILWHDLRQKFHLPDPRILVCGLNPHAGESGYLGREEIDIINPVLRTYQLKGLQISLAMPADTLFTPAHLSNCDAVLAMYHDQGLPVLKSQGFGEAVNVTLGLPFIRTSVDHGTALDLAGTGQAKSSSLLAALHMALDMAADKTVN